MIRYLAQEGYIRRYQHDGEAASPEELMDEVRAIARNVLEETLEAGVTEWNQIKSNVKDDLSKYLYSKTKRKPMILPVIMNV